MKGFWETKTLQQMNPEQWEMLCDGCGLCCLVKIEDDDSGEIFNTTVSCRRLDVESCRCGDYKNRLADVAMCTLLTLQQLPLLNWLPETCAYKRLFAGEPLPSWHPLITKNKNSVHESGISAKWFAQSEKYIHPEQLNEFVIMADEK